MLGSQLPPPTFLARAAQEIARVDPSELQALGDAVDSAYRRRRTVFVIGNGGSGANASHLAEDLGKCSIPRDRIDDDSFPRLRIISLTDNTSYITAWANDESYDRVFSEQLRNLAEPGDLLIAISGSGNSPNILRAVEWANRRGLTTFACTGYSGGKLRQIARQSLHVPVDDMGLVESIHLIAFHWVVGDLARRLAHPVTERMAA